MPAPHRRNRPALPGMPYDLGVDKDFDDLWKAVHRLEFRISSLSGGTPTASTVPVMTPSFSWDPQFVVVAADDRLPNARVLTGTANQVNVAAGTATLSLPQNIHTGASPTFAGLTLTGLTGVLQATVGVVSGSAAHSALASIGANDHHAQAHVLTGGDHTESGLTTGHVLTATGATTFAWAAPTGYAPTSVRYVVLAVSASLSAEEVLTGTADQVTVTPSGADGGNVVLSLPQSIATASTPQFARIGLGAAADATAVLLGQMDGIGITQTIGAYLRNTTAATAILNQISPTLEFGGYGWKSGVPESAYGAMRIWFGPSGTTGGGFGYFSVKRPSDAGYTNVLVINPGGITANVTIVRGANAITGAGDIGQVATPVGNAYITNLQYAAGVVLNGTTNSGMLTLTGGFVGEYQTQSGVWANPTGTAANGRIVTVYNSDWGTRLYVYSNGGWTYITTTVV